MDTTALAGAVVVPADAQDGLLSKAERFQNRVAQLQVTNDLEYQQAAELARQVKGLQSEAEAYWEPMRASAWGAYQAVLNSKKQMLKPLQAAEAILKDKMSGYTVEQEHRRKEQEVALQAMAQAEMERKLEEARKARADGDEQGALYAEAEANVMQNMAVAGTVKASVPKAEGVTIRKKWVIESIDSEQVPIAFEGTELRPVDTKAVLRLINASKGTISIPGVKYRESVSYVIRK